MPQVEEVQKIECSARAASNRDLRKRECLRRERLRRVKQRGQWLVGRKNPGFWIEDYRY